MGDKQDDTLIYMGAPGSPYTRKMRSLLRYRRINQRMLINGAKEAVQMPRPKVLLLPTFFLKDEESGELKAQVDSTPLIRKFEQGFKGRATVPTDPVLDFFNYLLEDYGDEWLTKAMFHYRWANDADATKAAQILPRWSDISSSEDAALQMGKLFRDRQVSRLYVVGSNDVTAPVIVASYERFLKVFDELLQQQPFLFGQRPSSADFALFGQLTQLALFDPTSMETTLRVSPRVYAWTEVVEDLSGLEIDEAGWNSRDELDKLKPLLTEIGRTYVPVMLANAKALMDGAEQVEAEVEGKPWHQQPFPYQVKCLQWVRDAFQGLSAADQDCVQTIIAGTGVENLLS